MIPKLTRSLSWRSSASQGTGERMERRPWIRWWSGMQPRRCGSSPHLSQPRRGGGWTGNDGADSHPIRCSRPRSAEQLSQNRWWCRGPERSPRAPRERRHRRLRRHSQGRWRCPTRTSRAVLHALRCRMSDVALMTTGCSSASTRRSKDSNLQ